MHADRMDTYFYALHRVINVIYAAEEGLADILYFIVSLAAELTGGKGATIRVLEQGTFNLKVVSSHGLSPAYLRHGAIDAGRSVAEILRGEPIIINDLSNDRRIHDPESARREGLAAVIGLPFTVNETTYSILRVYYAAPKVPTQEEMDLLYSLGRLSCLAIERTAVQGLTREAAC